MADKQPAAEAVATSPAEVTKADASLEVEAGAKQEAAADVAKTDATDNTKAGAKKPYQKGSTDAVQREESPVVDKVEELYRRSHPRKDKDDRKDRDSRPKYDCKDRDYRRHGKFEHKKRAQRTDEFDNLPETDDPTEIRKQVEFYFSAANLATDEHLFKEMEGPRNAPVPIKHINSFRRMRRFKPYSAVVAALRESEDLVVVDDEEFSGPGNEGVKRKVPLTVPKRDGDADYPPTLDDLYKRLFRLSLNNMANSVYVRGFAGEGEDVAQIPLETFFRPFGSVMVRKRRDNEGKWKGSVFVEFDTGDSAKQFLALDPKPKFNDNELTIMSKQDYSEMKCKEKGIIPNWLKSEEECKEEDKEKRNGYRGGQRRSRVERADRAFGPARRGGGGYGSRYNGRDDRRDRHGRDRDHSDDSKDWNRRRDNFQKKDKRDDKAGGDSKKRKADAAEDDSPKRVKLQIKEDE